MVISIRQPCYLPWLGFFYHISQCDIHVLLDNVQYVKRDFESRNRIKTPQGSLWLTVPVKTKGRYRQNLMEVEIDNSQHWSQNHWRALELNYKKTAHFKEYQPFFKDFYAREWEKLVDLNIYSISYLTKILGIKTQFIRSSELKVTGRGTELMINICKELGSKIYFSGPKGQRYLDGEIFKKEGIELYFFKYNHPTYPQRFGSFISNLSIVDLLFNHGNMSLDILSQNQEKLPWEGDPKNESIGGCSSSR